MLKKILLSLVAILSISASAFAQKQVTGKVVDGAGNDLPGVVVIIEGTHVGVSTNENGEFTIKVPDGKDLVFTAIGMKTKTVEYNGEKNLQVTLEEDPLALEEAVVTALGITKSEKSLGFAATTVKNEELTASRSDNAMNALSGKVAGLQISGSSTTAGSAQSVIIRGISSISGNNQPLYVIDGVPLATVNVTNTYADQANMSGGISSLNPDDIASMTILKGAAATALYGSRASGGVIVINTKGGSNYKKPQVTVNAGMQFSNVSRLPQFQNAFGTGWDGSWTKDENGSWGPMFNDKIRIYGPEYKNSQMIKNYSAMPNNIRDFYDTGLQWNVSAALEGGSDKMTYYLSYAHTGDDGILPSNKDTYDKNTIAARGSYQAYKWLKLSSSFNFSTQKTSQVNQDSAKDSMIEGLYQSGRDISFIDMQDLSNPFNTPEAYFTPYTVLNPYWIIDNAHNTVDMKKFFGKVQMDVNPIEQLTITYRYGLDYTDYDRKLVKNQINVTEFSPNSDLNQEGAMSVRYGRSFETNHDVLVNFADNYFNNKFSVNLTAGMNVNERFSTYSNSAITGFTFDTGFWDLSNTPNNPSIYESQSLRRSISVFGDFQFGYDDQVFLDVTMRNDWSSTLPLANNSFFYPGVTASWIFTKALGLDENDAFSFGKLRLAYGKTGNDPGVYMTNSTYVQGEASTYFGASTPNGFPLAGYNGYMQSATLASSSLQPEMTTEYEVGLDLRFFSGRIGLDAAYYNRLSDMQIFPLPVEPATGYRYMNMNMGKVRNQGVELMLNTIPVRTQDFKWAVDLTWSKNFNMVETLPEGLDGNKALIDSDGWGDVYMYAEVGKPIGQLYATMPSYTESGQLICDEKGLPILSEDSKWTGFDVQNKWTGGLSTEFTWKNLSVGCTFDFRYGGKMYSRTKSLLWFTGNGIETSYNDRKAFVIPNSVVSDGNGGYVENTEPITLFNSRYQYIFAGNDAKPLEGSGYCLIDRSYAKLANAHITYSFPQKLINKIRLQGLSLSLVGNNLYTWTPASNCYIDPNQGYTTDLKGMLGEYFCTVPCMYYGFNVKIIF